MIKETRPYVTVITAMLLCVSMDVSKLIIQGKITEVMYNEYLLYYNL